MPLHVEALNWDSHDPKALADFWTAALDYEIADEGGSSSDGERWVEITPKDGSGNNILFYEVHDEKTVKNRLHLDLRPDDQDAEVERIEALGAKRVDIGQGELSETMTWVVMADPEGNEFCILRPKQGREQI